MEKKEKHNNSILEQLERLREELSKSEDGLLFSVCAQRCRDGEADVSVFAYDKPEFWGLLANIMVSYIMDERAAFGSQLLSTLIVTVHRATEGKDGIRKELAKLFLSEGSPKHTERKPSKKNTKILS